jgi:hypothetical protein
VFRIWCNTRNKGCARGVYIYRLETRMRILRVAVVAISSLFPMSLAFCCSCSYGPPIQKTLQRERERAVFTAHIVQPIGEIDNQDGQRLSNRVLAIVLERYWGLPWYWPRVVILDGGYQCGTVMAIGEDYLVSGSREHYGVLAVDGCSRTRPLKSAQLDLRTLNGSHCAVPGGSVIGYVRRGNDEFRGDHPIAADVSVRLRDQNGKAFTTQSDGDGIYELRHLATGAYTVESLVSQGQYASSAGVSVVEGQCVEMPVLLKDYSLRGRLLPGLNATVKLVGGNVPLKQIGSDSIEPDGRFYFRNVPDGEYILSVTTWIGAANDFYYPGTFDRPKATRVRIMNHMLAGGQTLDFNPEALPMVPVPVTLDPPTNSGRFSWRVLLSSNNMLQEGRWASGTKFVFLYGMRGASYSLGLFGDSNHPLEYGNCRSGLTPVVATPGMATIHIAVPPSCQ